MRIILVFLLMILLPNITRANELWDSVRFDGLARGKKYGISMGSGFFINNNHIVTNRHVVSNCKNIAIRGAVKPTKATLLVLDKELDLALLYSPNSPVTIPYLRINYNAIQKNDILFTAGYPLQKADSGEFVVRSSEVLDVIKSPKHGFSSIKFRDVIDHGNSGGPLLDKSSNIVGVVTAELRYYKDNEKTPSETIGVAIGLDGIVDFLQRNGSHYISNSSYDIFTNYAPEKIIKDYIVNIHCVKD